jgi:hypothetical protein
MSPARARAAVPFAGALIVLLAGCGRATSGAQKMAACIESSDHGWHRVTHAFQIKGLRHLDLMTAWVGGSEVEPYDDVYSLNPRVHFELAVLGRTPFQEANQTRLLRAVETDPSPFELVLVSTDAPQTPGGGSGIVEDCSDRLYPHQGP